MRLRALALGLAIAIGGCTVTDEPPVATVADVVRALPDPGTSVRATVTDRREGEELLVELSDPNQEEHIWVSGFSRAPGRGEEIWTVITGPPVAHDLVGVVYPSSGVVVAPVAESRVTPRSALAALLGAVAAVSLGILALVAASGWARRSRARRCGGCGSALAPDWVTCPRCGRSLAAGNPASPRVEEYEPSTPAPAAGSVDESSRPTRITRGDVAP